MKTNEKKIIQGYESFLTEDNWHSPPGELGDNIRTEVMRDIDPSTFSVVLKLLVIHLFMSSLTLIICPQFGIGPIGGGNGLMGFVSSYGHVVCGLFCGAFFFSGSLVVASLILTNAQKRKIYSNRYATFLGLTLISLVTLIFLSSMINGMPPHMHIEFIFSWIFAAFGLSLLISKISFVTLERVAFH